MTGDLPMLIEQCAAAVHPQTMSAIVRVESGNNPFAIGVVNARLERQPATLQEAVATARALEVDGYNFSLGLAQVNRYNLARFGLDYESAFDACKNLAVGASILKECYDRATPRFTSTQHSLQAAFSCYYSGNFVRGFRTEDGGQPSYVQKVVAVAGVQPIRVTRATRGALAKGDSAQRADTAKTPAHGDAVMVFR